MTRGRGPKLALLCGGGMLGAGLIPAVATAQVRNAPADSPTLQVVVVTVQQRSEDLQAVPISAQVVARAAMQQQSFISLQDLAQVTPAVHVSDIGSFSNSVYVRGIGSGNNAAFDQSVSNFVDDLYFGRSRLTDISFLDLSQIELLKGPQTTFFGNNAIAGALHMVTADPSMTARSGYARALYGSYDTYALEAADGGPVNNWLAVRAAAIIDGGAGWIHNVNTGKSAPDTSNKAGRLTVRAEPTPDFDASWKLEGGDNLTLGAVSGLSLQWTNCPAPAPIGAAAPSGFCKQALVLHVPQGLHNDDNTGLAGQSQHLKTFDTSLKMNLHALGRTWTSVTGFVSFHDLMTRDTDMTPVEQLTATFTEGYSQFSQEFRVASATGGQLEYLAGAYFQFDTVDFSTEVPAPYLNGYTSRIPELKPLAAYLPLDAAPSFQQTERVLSAFASLSWHVTDVLKLTGSLRATQDDKRVNATLHYGQATSTYGGYAPVPRALEPLWSVVLGPPGSKSLGRRDAAAMPSAQIQYAFAPQAMGYASYSRAFKAGGINGQNGLGSVSIPRYGPEYVNAYEIGLKSTLLDNRLRLNLDVFRSDYTDLQVSTELYHPVTNIYSAEVDNAAAARSEGVELQAMWAAGARFRFGVDATYLNAYYVSYPNGAPTTLAAFEKLPSSNFTGQPTNYAPRWSGSLYAQYRQAMSDRCVLEVELSPYLSSSYNTHSDDPFLKVPGHVRLDGRISVETRDGRWAADLIGKNLTNATIIAIPGVYLEAKEEPINVALQLRKQW